MKKLITLFLMALPFFILSQTYIKDKEEVSGTWTTKGSPYIIEGEAIVPEGKVLTIKPGVRIEFNTSLERDYLIDGEKNPNFKLGFLRVNGKLIAKGKAKKMIIFDRKGNSDYWGNVSIINSKDSHLEYCHFRKSYYIRSIIPTDNATGSLTFINSTGTVKNCIFANNGWTALNCKKGSAPILENLTIFNNEYGIECNSKSNPMIKNVILFRNNTTFYINGDSNPSISNSSIEDSKLPEDLKDEGGNVLSTNPMFVFPDENDFKLHKDSPIYNKKIGVKF